MPQGQPDDAFLKDATDQLHDRFQITHVTLQVVQAPFVQACDALDGSCTPALAAASKSPVANPDHPHDHDPGHAH
jgi:cobalt-zinc-cadmium efflux system protein